MSFASLGLSDALVRAVNAHGYTTPTPIQTRLFPPFSPAAICWPARRPAPARPPASCCRCCSGCRPARRSPSAARAQALARADPDADARTRGAGRGIGRASTASILKLTSTVVFGGVGIGPQTAQLKRGVDILVATPGRLLDHHGQGNVDFSRIEIFVLDEADRMLDMGFVRDIKRVLALLPAKRQNLLFSATFSGPDQGPGRHAARSSAR